MLCRFRQRDSSLDPPRPQKQTAWKVSDQPAAVPSSLPPLPSQLVVLRMVSSLAAQLAATVEARAAIVRKGNSLE